MPAEDRSEIPFPPADVIYSEEPSVTEENSIIANTPELAHILDAIHRFNNSPTKEEKARSGGRERFGREVIAELLDYAGNDPGKIFNLVESARLISELKNYRSEIFINQLEKAIEKITLPLDPAIIGQWFQAWVENPLHGGMAERVLGNNFAKRTNQKAVVDFIYEFCLGSLTSGNPRVRDATMSVLALETDFLPGYNKEQDDTINTQTRHYLEGIFSNDDNVLRRSLEIDQAFHHVGMGSNRELLEKQRQNSVDANSLLAESSGRGDNHGGLRGGKWNNYWYDYFRIAAKHPELKMTINPDGLLRFDATKAVRVLSIEDIKLLQKFANLLEYFSSISVDDTESAPLRKNLDPKQFPYNLLLRPGRLGQWVNDSLAQQLRGIETDEEHVVIRLPDFEIVTSGQIEGTAEAVYQKILKVGAANTEPVNADDEKYWRTIFHLLPRELRDHPEKISSLTKLCDAMAKEICEQARYSLSPRGDQALIQDQATNRLGFASVAYDIFEENKKWTAVSVPVGNYNFRLLVDEYGDFRDYESHESLNFSGRAVFLRYLILSHLREIKCSERVSASATGKSGKGNREGFTDRRGHVRRLQIGQKPSPAMELAARENGIDLARVNELLRQNGEDRLRTFIPPTQVAFSGKGRIVCVAPEAMNKYEETVRGS